MNEDATIYDNGSACFDEELVEVCGEADHNMGGTMRFINSEYDGIREYSIDFSCELVASGASYIAATFVAAIATLNMFWGKFTIQIYFNSNPILPTRL